MQVVEQMRGTLSQQQAANEQMLQSLSSDQKSIKGEMVRFVEAMKEAVAFDVEGEFGTKAWRQALTMIKPESVDLSNLPRTR